MKFSIETERLILREMRFEDIDGLFELDSNPEVHKYLGNNCVKDIEQVKKIVTSVKQQYIENGIGRWSMIDKKSGEFTAKNGKVWFVQAIPVTEEGGKIIGVLEMCRDITESKAAETLLQEKQIEGDELTAVFDELLALREQKATA